MQSWNVPEGRVETLILGKMCQHTEFRSMLRYSTQNNQWEILKRGDRLVYPGWKDIWCLTSEKTGGRRGDWTDIAFCTKVVLITSPSLMWYCLWIPSLGSLFQSRNVTLAILYSRLYLNMENCHYQWLFFFATSVWKQLCSENSCSFRQ